MLYLRSYDSTKYSQGDLGRYIKFHHESGKSYRQRNERLETLSSLFFIPKDENWKREDIYTISVITITKYRFDTFDKK